MLLPAVFHENLFDDWFDPFFDDMDRELNRESRQVFGKRGANMMKTDVKDTGSAYEVAVDLPGCKKEDVKMELDNGYLTIQAVRSHNQKFEDGVLKITLPHAEQKKELPAADANLIKIE